MNWLQKFDKSFEEVILGVLLVGMSIILMLQILMRAIVGHSLTWAEELARYFYVWSVFLSIGCTIRVGNILRVDLLLNMLPQGLRKIMEILLDVLSVVLYSFLAYASISVVQKVQTGGQTSPAMKDVVLPEAELKILAEKGAGVKDLVRKQVGDETMNAFLDSLK